MLNKVSAILAFEQDTLYDMSSAIDAILVLAMTYVVVNTLKDWTNEAAMHELIASAIKKQSGLLMKNGDLHGKCEIHLMAWSAVPETEKKKNIAHALSMINGVNHRSGDG